MALIPAGSFTMGSNDFDDEKDPHEVPLAAFCLDRHEVTVGEYRGCGGCSPPGTAEYCNWGVSGRDRHPINCVDWDQATAYCAAVGKRLPTEEEWEYAARGSEGRTYPWGKAAPSSQLCWDGEGSDLGKGNRKSTCVVGSYPAGLFGLFDMAGNVSEWTSGRYCPYTSKNCAEDRRVYRGGCWRDDVPQSVRGANRSRDEPGSRVGDLGFRCAR
jgi:formylglycine-generating enzyme required for sulfatase activity